jgi:predicted small secreted protein
VRYIGMMKKLIPIAIMLIAAVAVAGCHWHGGCC